MKIEMTIETTMNMRIEVLEKLEEAAEKSDISRTKLIVVLMKKLLCDSKTMARAFTRIKYQDRAPKPLWRRVHITIFSRDYEYFIDMRKMYKKSVSYLAALAINGLLDDFIDEYLRDKESVDMDNYPFQGYLISLQHFNDVVRWTIYWGIPDDPTHVFPL